MIKKIIIKFTLICLFVLNLSGCSTSASVEFITENIQGLWKEINNESDKLYAFDLNEMYIYESDVTSIMLVNSYDYTIQKGKIEGYFTIFCENIDGSLVLNIKDQVYVKATENDYEIEMNKAFDNKSVLSLTNLEKFVSVDFPNSTLMSNISENIKTILDIFISTLSKITDSDYLTELYFVSTDKTFSESEMIKLNPTFTNSTVYSSVKLHVDIAKNDIVIDYDLLANGEMGGFIYKVTFESDDTSFNIGGTGPALSAKYSSANLHSSNGLVKTSHSYAKDIVLSNKDYSNLKKFLASSNHKIIFSMVDNNSENILEMPVSSSLIEIFETTCFLYEAISHINYFGLE